MPLVPAPQVQELLTAIYQHHGSPPEEAEQVAAHQVRSHLVGHESHGALRTDSYIEQIKKGQVVPGAPTDILVDTPGVTVIDGNWNFGFVVARRAVKIAVDKAKTIGSSSAIVRRQGHIGRLGEYTAEAAANGCIAILTADSGNGPKVAVPYGGTDPRLGSNPISIAAPSSRGPVVLDMATTAIAGGKLRVAIAEGKQVPLGWILDKQGNPTTNPQDLFDGGSMLPLGGDQAHKGYGLSFMIEILSGILTGIGYGSDGSGFHNDGIFFAAFSVEHFRPLAEFEAEVDGFIDWVKTSGLATGFDEILYPGELEARLEQERLAGGFFVDESTWSRLQVLAAEAGYTGPSGKEVV